MAMSNSVRRVVEQSEEDATLEGATVCSFELVEKLQNVGVNAADIKKLKEGGYHTVGQILMTPSKLLLEIKGFSDAKVEKVQEACRKLQNKMVFKRASETLLERQKVKRITTGCKELDAILGGGVETGSITEVFGEFRTGKTQLCHTLAVTCQLDEQQGGGSGKVIVVDTEGAFRVERVAQIAENRFSLSPDDVLDNILIARVFTHEDQIASVEHIAAKMAEDEEPTSLIIVDSVMALFRTEFSGRGELSERQQKLNRYLMSMTKLAEEFNVAVLCCNQVTADPGASLFAGGDAKKPIGGHVMAHAATTRVYLRKGKGEQRIAKIYDSPNMPEAEATFSITPNGVNDAD